MTSKKEQVLEYLKGLLATALAPTEVKRNVETPEAIKPDGLIIIRDGEPGEPEQFLGGFSMCIYTHRIEVEIYCQKNTGLDNSYDQIVQKIGAALESNPYFGGLITGKSYGQPAPSNELIDGAADIKTAVLDLFVEYDTPSPLS